MGGSNVLDPEEYLRSLTPQVEELIRAIKAPKGVFVIYGPTKSGKSTFLRWLDIVRGGPITPRVCYLRLYTGQIRTGVELLDILGDVGKIETSDQEDLQFFEKMEPRESKLWIETTQTPKTGIPFTSQFDSLFFSFSPEFIKASKEFLDL